MKFLFALTISFSLSQFSYAQSCGHEKLCKSLSKEYDLCRKNQKKCGPYLSIFKTLLEKKKCTVKANPDTGESQSTEFGPMIFLCSNIINQYYELLTKIESEEALKILSSQAIQATLDGELAEDFLFLSQNANKILRKIVVIPNQKLKNNVFNIFAQANQDQELIKNSYTYGTFSRHQLQLCIDTLDSKAGYLELFCGGIDQYIAAIFRKAKGGHLLFITRKGVDEKFDYWILDQAKGKWVSADSKYLSATDQKILNQKKFVLELPLKGTTIKVLNKKSKLVYQLKWNRSKFKLIKN